MQSWKGFKLEVCMLSENKKELWNTIENYQTFRSFDLRTLKSDLGKPYYCSKGGNCE